MDDVEAQKAFGTVLRDVEARRASVVVERNGAPVAAVIPFDLYNQWKRSREAFFGRLEATAARANVPEEEATSLALEAQRAVRAD